MRLSLQRLEEVFLHATDGHHCDENNLRLVFDQSEKLSTGVEEAWPILYSAARNVGGVELIDVFFCVRKSSSAIQTLMQYVFDSSNAKEVKLLEQKIRADAREMVSVNFHVLHLLGAWIAKEAMMKIAKKVREDNAAKSEKKTKGITECD